MGRKMPRPNDFIPAGPPFLPAPNIMVRYGLNDYMELPETGPQTAEEKLLHAIFGKEKTILMVRCHGCGKWLEESEAIYLNNIAYHSPCASKVTEGG